MPDPDLTSDFAGYGVFGLNTDGSIDQEDNGQGAWGANTRDPTLRGVALPEDTIRRYIGDPTTPAVQDAIRRGAYQVDVTAGDGRHVSMPIVDIGPGKSTGRGIDLTYAAYKALGLTNGTGVVHYRLYAGEPGLQQPQGEDSGDLPHIEEAESQEQPEQQETPPAAQTTDPSPLGMLRQQHPEYADQSDEALSKKVFEIKSFGMQYDDFARAFKDPNGASTINQAQAKYEQTRNPLQRFMDQNPQYAGQDEAVKKKLYDLYKIKHPQVNQDDFNHLLEPDGGHQSWTKVVADTMIETGRQVVPQSKLTGMELWRDVNEMENTAIDRNLDDAFGFAYPGAQTTDQKQQLYSKYYGIKDPGEREKAFLKDLQSQPGLNEALQKKGMTVDQVLASFNSGMNGLDHRKDMEQTHAWMNEVVGAIDKESAGTLPENQEKVAKFIAQQPANLLINIVPGVRELGNYAMLYGQNKQYLETKMPTLGADQIDQMARKMADAQFPAQEVLALVMARGGGALTASLTNKFVKAGVDLTLPGVTGAAVFSSNQLVRNLGAKQPLTEGLQQAAGEGFAVGSIGGAMGLTVRGINQFLSTSMKGKQVSGTLEKVSIMTPKEANDFAAGGNENPVVQARDFTALDLGIAAVEQHLPESVLHAVTAEDFGINHPDIRGAQRFSQNLGGPSEPYPGNVIGIERETIIPPHTEQEYGEVSERNRLAGIQNTDTLRYGFGLERSPELFPKEKTAAQKAYEESRQTTQKSTTGLKTPIFLAGAKINPEAEQESLIPAFEEGLTYARAQKMGGDFQAAKDARDAGDHQTATQHLNSVLQELPPESHEAIAATIRGMVDTLVEKPHERTTTPAGEWKELGVTETEADIPAEAEKKIDPQTGATSWRMPARTQEAPIVQRYFGTDEAPSDVVRPPEAYNMARGPKPESDLGNPFSWSSGPKREKAIRRILNNLEMDDTPENREQVQRNIEEEGRRSEEIAEQAGPTPPPRPVPEAAHEDLIKNAYARLRRRTGRDSVHITDLIEELGGSLSPEQVKSWLSMEAGEKGRGQLDEGDIGAATQIGKGDYIDFMGRKRTLVDLSAIKPHETPGAYMGFMPENVFAAGRRSVAWLNHFTHFEDFARNWNKIFAPERNAQEARDVAQIGRGTIAGEKNQAILALRQIAEANKLDEVINGGLKSDRRATEFTKYGKAKLIEMISARERGQKIGDPKLDSLFDFYNRVTDFFGKRAKANGIKMDSWIDNYFPHMIKGDKATQNEAVSKIKRMWGDPSFTKHRQIPTTDLAVRLGYEMRSYNPEHVIQAYIRSVNRAISQIQLGKQMEEEGYAWDTKGHVPDVAQDWPTVRTPDGITRHLSPETKQVLDNMFSTSSIYDTLAGPATRVAGLVKGFTGIKFAWSGFHAVHIMGVDLAQALASVQKRGMSGTMKGEDFMKLLGRATGPVEMVRKGGAPFGKYKGQYGNLIEVMRGEASAETLSDEDKINRRDLLEMGIVPHVSHDREMAWTNWISQQAQKIGPVSKAAGLGYKILISEPYQKYMFGKLIPALKISSALEARDSLLRENPSLRAPENKVQRMREYDRIQRDIEGRFGEMNYDNLLWNGMAKQIGINVPTSLGWTLGFWRIYGDGVTDTLYSISHFDEIAEAKGRGEKAELITERMLYMANYSALAMISCGLLSYAATGAYHGIMDMFFPAVGTDKNGKVQRVRTPFFTTEWASLYAHNQKEGLAGGAVNYFGNKLNPGLQTLWEMYNNKDFRGREMRDPVDPWPQQMADTVWFAVKNLMLPISVENQTGQGAAAHEGLSALMGLSPAPTWTSRTGAENDILNAYFQEKGEPPAMTKAKGEVYDAKKAYQQAIVDKDPGKIAKTKAELERLGATPKSIRDAEHNANISPADRLFKTLSPKRQLAILSSLNPQERAHYLPVASKEVQHEWLRDH